jgi:peptidoglycan/LPS O-acetylase OafA/YrhL
MPLLVLLGEASYAIYILHVPLRNWTYKVLEWFHPGIHPSLQLLAVYTVFTLGVSILVFKVIEEPARRLIRRKLSPAVP